MAIIDVRTFSAAMKAAPDTVSVPSVISVRAGRRKALRTPSSHGRPRPTVAPDSRRVDIPTSFGIPVSASAARTVIAVAVFTGNAAAASGTTRPTTGTVAFTHIGIA